VKIINALTVDVEDYFQVSAFEKIVRRDDWQRWECRVEPNTRRILDLLNARGVKATFFILGWVAERYPGLVREIDSCGHEIASHGYWHRLVYELTPAEFRDDLRRSRDALETAVGKPVTAHRAASFSITGRSLWALDILAEEGFKLDSSIFPVRHDRYGIPDSPTCLHLLQTAGGPLWEFPAAVARFAGVNVPVGGGGYFRLFPLRWTTYCLRRINRRTREPFMFYVHPWELDADQPRVPAASRVSRFRHYVNLAKTHNKLDKLLGDISFGRICDAIGQRAKDNLATTNARRPAGIIS
jgi:polysaccharide deacetylase family protein (PEP-CTERM system associated)